MLIAMFLRHRFNIGSTELKWRFVQIEALIVLVSEIVSVGGLFVLRPVANDFWLLERS
jgi:hypothetical protein